LKLPFEVLVLTNNTKKKSIKLSKTKFFLEVKSGTLGPQDSDIKFI